MNKKTLFPIIIFWQFALSNSIYANSYELSQYTVFWDVVIPGEALIDEAQLPHSQLVGLLISGGDNSGFCSAVQSNHRAFAKARGIPYQYQRSDSLKPQLEFADEPGKYMAAYYYKIPLLFNLLFNGDVEDGKYIVYIDDDVVMNDFDPHHLPMFDRIIAAYPDASVILTRDVFSDPWLNNGVMIFKKNDFSRGLVGQWWTMRPKNNEQQSKISYLDQGLLRQIIQYNPVFSRSASLRLIAPRQGELNLNTFRHSHCDWYSGDNFQSLASCYPGVVFPDGFAAKSDATIHHPGLSAKSKREEIVNTLKLVENSYPLIVSATRPQQIHQLLEERQHQKEQWKRQHERTIAWEQWRDNHFTLAQKMASKNTDSSEESEQQLPEKPGVLRLLPRKRSVINGYRRLDQYHVLSGPLILKPGATLDCQGNILFMNSGKNGYSPDAMPAVVEMKASSQLMNCIIMGEGFRTGIKILGPRALVRNVVIHDVDYGLDLSSPLPPDTFSVSKIQFLSGRDTNSALIFRVRIVNPNKGYTYPGNIPVQDVAESQTGRVPGCHHQLVDVKGISGIFPAESVPLPSLKEDVSGFGDVLLLNPQNPPSPEKLSGTIAELTLCNTHNARINNLEIHSDLDYPFRLYHSNNVLLSGLDITGKLGGVWVQHVSDLDFGDSRIHADQYAVMTFGIRASTLHHLDLNYAGQGFGLWLSGAHFTYVRDSRVGRFHTDHRDINASQWFYNNQLTYPGEEHIAATSFQGPSRIYRKWENGEYKYLNFMIGNQWKDMACSSVQQMNQHSVCTNPDKVSLPEVNDISPLASYPRDISGSVIRESGYYRLTGDRSFPFGLVIDADNVTVDCMGYQIKLENPDTYSAVVVNSEDTLLYNCFFQPGAYISGVFPPQYITETHYYKEMAESQLPTWFSSHAKVAFNYHPPRIHTNLISPKEGLFRDGSRLKTRIFKMHYAMEKSEQTERGVELFSEFEIPLVVVFLYSDYALNHMKGMGAGVHILK